MDYSLCPSEYFQPLNSVWYEKYSHHFEKCPSFCSEAAGCFIR